MSVLHLWEHEHPYYCSEGNYFKNGLNRQFESWAEFASPSSLSAMEDVGNLLYDFDDDLNLLWRWDWNVFEREVYDEGGPDEEISERSEVLHLFFMLQRKAYNMSAEVQVTADDEPTVRAWLESKALHMRRLWEPLLDDPKPADSGADRG